MRKLWKNRENDFLRSEPNHRLPTWPTVAHLISQGIPKHKQTFIVFPPKLLLKPRPPSPCLAIM